MTYTVRSMGPLMPITTEVEADGFTAEGGLVRFRKDGEVVHTAGLGCLIDVRIDVRPTP